MTRVWTPEELGDFEAKIRAARSGDVGEATSLLRWITRILEQDLPLPESLRTYLVRAFREITKDEAPDVGIRLPPHPNFTNMAELRENLRFLEETRDANTALNLTRPRGRKQTARRASMESAIFAMMVNTEREKGQSLEKAIGTVADQMGVSDKTVSRAWHRMKDQLYPNRDSK
jgi:hypothetical protein